MAYVIVYDGDVIDGIFLPFDSLVPDAKIDTLCMLGIKEEQQGSGIGLRVLKKIDEIHSDIPIWRLDTPAYAFRNVVFFVNRCGFVVYQITTGKGPV